MNPRSSALLLVALVLLAGAPSRAIDAQAAQPSPSTALTNPAASAAALPAGVIKVRFGAAVRDRTLTGVARCTIPEPLAPPPRFEPGGEEMSYVIDVDPLVAKAVEAKVVGDLGCPEPWSKGCVGYTVCGGGVCQNQFGATLSCPDGKALKKGSYRLVVTVTPAVDPAKAAQPGMAATVGKTFEVPFEIQ
jgi:hypothetical protein